MTPQALKASILQLAIQGKLVPQRPEEGTAEELYQQIQAEKQQLIANGTIKREKTLAPIKEDEIPFDIPETWKWVRLGDISKGVQYGTSQKSISDGRAIVLRMGNIQDGEIDFSNIVYSNNLSDIEKLALQRGDVLFNRTNSKELVGKSAIFRGHTAPVIFAGYIIRVNQFELIDSEYLNHYLNSPFAKETAKEVQSLGINQANISGSKLVKYIFPLPPQEEQKRIVAKIEEMLPLIDRYGEAYTELETFNKRFPDDLRKSILQEAIQGKLVPQRPEEGTAEELYQQIQAEKQRLIAAGTIKKEKPLPPIEEKAIPFDIPETWKWVRWGEIVNVVSARRVHQSDWKTSGVPFYRAREIAALAEKASIQNELYISDELYHKLSESGIPRQGDVMVTAVGTLGKAYIVKDRDRFYYKDASVICLENIGQIEPKYIKYALDSEMMKAQIKANSSGTTVGTLTIVRMNAYLIPLPPLAEQKRIVAKIEEMLALCKELS